MGKFDAKKKSSMGRGKHHRFDQTHQEEKMPLPQVIMEYAHDLGYVLVTALILFSFIGRIVIVNGDSMFRTLAHGDWLLLINNPVCGELEQGDVVVASLNRFRGGDAIVKRVIATEGQVVDIDFVAGVVYVDGEALEEPYTNTATNLAEGMRFPLVVEDGCVFLMGDNRNESMDSRDPEIGLVDIREILGKAVLVVFPGTGSKDHPVDQDFGRIGGID